VAGLIAALSPDKPAVVIGHDLGAHCLDHGPRSSRPGGGPSLACRCPTPAPQRSVREIVEAVYTSQDRFFHMHSFEAEGVAEAEFDADVRGGLRRFFYAWSGDAPAEAWPSYKGAGDPVLLRVPDPDPFPAWLTAADIDYYVSELEQSGFRGPLNRYRNNDRDFAFLRGFEGRRIEQPALYIGGERDRVLQMFGDRLPVMRSALPDLRGLHLLPGCGHWTQQERPQAVNDHLLTWLRGL
jgi:pimeloyl-ACP methyl ester carboxylesterase